MRRLAALLLAATAAACGGSSGGGGGPGPREATPLPAGGPVPVTAFAQTVADTGGLGEVFPGQANTWVLDRDFALAQGYGLQYASALALFVGTPSVPLSHGSLLTDLFGGGLAPFPYDQGADEVVFLTPAFGAADGVRTAAASDGLSAGVPPLSGTRSGYLNGTSDSRLVRTVSIASGTSYTLSWTDEAFLVAGKLVGAAAAPHAPYYQVVLRDVATGAAIGTPLFSTDQSAGQGAHSVPLPAGLPAQVDLSFELRSEAGGIALIDDVVLSDGGGPVAAFTNGGFEDPALAPWRAGAAAESQNVRSGARDVVPGLRVTRTFLAPPSATWGRLVDVFENTTGSPISTSAVYLTLLGGDTPLAAVRAGGEAVVAWDADGLARDVGLVFGSGTALVQAGSGFVFLVHPVSVPAGGKVALVHFVVQLGGADGGLTAANVPAATDTACSTIASGFPATEAYALDLEAGVLPVIANF